MLHVNLRPAAPDDEAEARGLIESSVALVAAEHDVAIDVHGGFGRPPKPMTSEAEALFELVKQAGAVPENRRLYDQQEAARVRRMVACSSSRDSTCSRMPSAPVGSIRQVSSIQNSFSSHTEPGLISRVSVTVPPGDLDPVRDAELVDPALDLVGTPYLVYLDATGAVAGGLHSSRPSSPATR